MHPKSWIILFQQWLEDNQGRLAHDQIRVEVLGITSYTPSSIHVDLFAARHEVTVQLWEDGQSDFHFLNWEAADRDPNYQVEVTHYDFETAEQLLSALDQLVSKLSPALALV